MLAPADPLRAILQHLLARAADQLRAGQPSEAIPLLRQAAALRPGDAAILHDLGLASLACGETDGAIAALRASLAANDAVADTHLRLGIALEAAGALEAAASAYARAEALQPALADAAFRAGDLADSIGRSGAAAAAYRRAAAAAPDTTLGRIAAAKACRAEGQDAAAERVLRRALAAEPENAAALEQLGTLLAETGRFEEARTTLLRAIARDPRRAGNYYEVSRCRPITGQDAALVANMRAALATPGLEPVQASRIHLGLAKAADDLGDYEQAMRDCDAAEALRNRVCRFNLAGFEALLDRVMAQTPADAGGASDDPTPILIMGLPRSGTTLVEQILSAHPQVHGAGELPFWNEHGHAGPEAAAEPAAAYLRLLRGIAPGAARVTDKMPLNLQWAGQIHAALPRATLIHCRRSPIDTALSIHRTHFNPRMPFPTGGGDLTGFIRGYRRLAAHWRRVVPPERFVEVDYESLIDAPEQEIRRLVASCGLDWNPACLHPERNKRSVKTPSKWQARQPIYRSSAGRWQAYAPWLGALRPLLDCAD